MPTIFVPAAKFSLSPGSTVSGSSLGNPGASCRWKKSYDCSRKRASGSNYETRNSAVRSNPSNATGSETISTSVARLIDTNVLVYRVDARFPEKREPAANLLEETVRSGECRIPHQALLEFYAAVTRQLPSLKK